MEENMSNPYVKIKVAGKVAGTLTLLGSELGNGGPYCFLVVSNGTIPALVSICEGAFDRGEWFMGTKGSSTFIGRKLAGTHSARASFKEKIRFMKSFGRCLGERVEYQMERIKE